jgi:NAD(P)H-dependent flavin oxidoreductase YrpB (nitropropane dioxygenase family)
VLTTPLCRTLGIEAPVLSVGFGPGASPELAAAVSNAGGLGVLGLSNAPADLVHARVSRTRELTDRPFGVNLLLHYENADETMALCLDAGVDIFVLFWGDVEQHVEQAHARGATVLLQVGSVAEAKRAAAAGVDAVIAQGVEAGGHVRGTTALSVLVPAIVDAVAPLPVGASGGIADGRGLAAALVLGAQIVSLGTRFVASNEAYVRDEWKERIVGATAHDTAYFEALFDAHWAAPHRALRNRIVADFEATGEKQDGTIGEYVRFNGEVAQVQRYLPFMATPDFHGDLEQAPLWAGQSVELVHEIKDAATIVAELVRDAETALYSTTTYSNAAQQSSANNRS